MYLPVTVEVMRARITDFHNVKGPPYFAPHRFTYVSKRYDKYVIIYKGYRSDGATGAWDIKSMSWWVHDVLCSTGKWSDGMECTNWQASTVLYDILVSEGRWFRARTWWLATFLFGGKKLKKI